MNSFEKTVSITGANGFIGGNLKTYFLNLGYFVNCLVRVLPLAVESNVNYFKYDLNEPINEHDFPYSDVIFHCAFLRYSATCENANEINIYGTKNLIKICKERNVKAVFFSSLSAHEDSRSNYGRNKLFLEGLFDLQKDLILKLGLVIGEGGIFATMEAIIRKSKFIPLIDNGSQPVQIVNIQDVLSICRISIERSIVGKFNIGEAFLRTLKDIYILIGEKNGRKNYFFPVSSYLLLPILKITERAGLILPISSENVLGLKYIKAWDTKADMALFDL